MATGIGSSPSALAELGSTSGIGVLCNLGALERMRFVIVSAGAGGTIDETIIMSDDTFASFVWRLVMGMAGARIFRSLFLMSWPRRMSALLDGREQVARSCFGDFQLDLQIFRQLEKMGCTAALQQKLKRHVFRLLDNQQHTQAVEEAGTSFPVHAGLANLVAKRSTGVFTTNIDEEIVGLVKNHGEVKSASRFRRSEVPMGWVLASGMLEKRFGYNFVSATRPNEHCGARLSGDAFKSEKRHWSMNFAEVQGSGSQASLYSPSATNSSAPLADLFLLRSLHAVGNLHAAGKTGLGKTFSPKHMFAYQYNDPMTKKRQWIFPIRHFQGSAVAAVRLKMCFAGVVGSYFEIEAGVEPYFCAVVSLGPGDKAVLVVARPWAWQWKHVSPLRKKPLAIRLFTDGAQQS